MPIAYRDSVALSNNSLAASITITKPVGVVSGDFLLAMVVGDSANVISGPAGWTELFNLQDFRTVSRRVSYWCKVAGGAEPADYTWSVSVGTQEWSGEIVAYSGVHPTDPIEFAHIQNFGWSSDGQAPIGPAFSHGPNAMSVAMGMNFQPGAANGTSTFTDGTYTEREDYANGCGGVSLYDKLIAAAGRIAGQVIDYTVDTATGVGAHFVLRDAGNTPPTTPYLRVVVAGQSFASTSQTAAGAPGLVRASDAVVIVGGTPPNAIRMDFSGAGFTELDDQDASNFSGYLAWKQGTGAEGRSYAGTSSSSQLWSLLTFVVANASITGANWARSAVGLASTSAVTPSVVVPTGGDNLFNLVLAEEGSISFTADASMQEMYDSSRSQPHGFPSGVTSIGMQLTYDDAIADGASGTRTHTIATSEEYLAYSLSFPPSNQAPNAPTLVSPANASTIDAAAGFTADITPSDPDPGDTTAAVAYRRKIVGAPSYEYWNATTGLWQGTVVWNTDVDGDLTFAAGKWTNGNTYQWSAATQDAAGLQGPFATDNTLVASTPATVTVTAPGGTVVDTTQPTVTWTVTDPEGNAQQTFEVRIESGAYGTTPGAGTAVTSSGEVNSAADREWTTSDTLTNGVTYRAFVRVKTNGQYSLWAYTTFTLSLNPPASPKVALTPEPDAGRMRIDLQGRDNLLSANQASIETDAADWQVSNNVAAGPVRSTAQSKDGAASVTWTASGIQSRIRVTTATSPSVVAGRTYTGIAAMKMGTAVTRQAAVQLYWIDAGGSIIASTFGTNRPINGSGWTALAVSAVAPANAVKVSIALHVEDAINGDVIYGDEIATVPTKPAPAGLQLPGTSGHYAWTPDHADLDITGDVDLRCRIAVPDWTPAVQHDLVCKWTTTGNQRSYFLSLANTGVLIFDMSKTGADFYQALSTVVLPGGVATAGATLWVRATRRQSDGRVQFFYATATDPGSSDWTKLGADVTLEAGSAMFSSTGAVEIGSKASGTSGNSTGVVYRAQVLDGIDGDAVLDVDFTDESQGWETGDTDNATGTDETGKTVTIEGASSLVVGQWTRGGIAAEVTHRVQRSLDGETWADVRDATSVVHNGAAIQGATVYDREAPAYRAVQYRALAEVEV